MNGAWHRIQVLLTEEGIRAQKYTREELLKPMRWRINFHVCNSEFEYAQMKRGFTERHCMLFALDTAHTRLNGFPMERFFEGTYGILWKDALAGFKELDLSELYAIFRSACQQFGNTVPADSAERAAIIRNKGLDFKELSQAYSLYVSKAPLNIADLYARMLSYAAKHAADFAFYGDISVPAE